MFSKADLIICGAGPVGCVIAERAAKVLDWKVMIIDKRNHIAGNCYDEYYSGGILIHKYGPHYFRSHSKALIDYLSQFTDWIPGNYFVKSYSRGEYFNFPINLSTLEQFFNRKFTAEEAREFLIGVRIENENPQNSEEFVLSRVGHELYEAFYLGYTKKQWDIHPKDLAPSVCGRIPIRFNNDCRYVDHKYQLTPGDGFTSLFQSMIDHPNIHLLLNTNYFDIKDQIKPQKATVYTGPVDAYFDYKLGKLPWRSLQFDFKKYHENLVQPVVQINFPNDFDYTRSVEIKHVTRQKHPHTVVSYEYPMPEGDPYYPIPNIANAALYKKYKTMADEEKHNKKVFFAGRLAQYTYMNTDEAIEIALKTFDEIKSTLNEK